MDANNPCPRGTEITSEIRCGEASQYTAYLQLNPKRYVQVGSWNGVPYQCSSQVGGVGAYLNDDSLHFNSNSSTDNRRFTTGEFVMICERGK